ncbi:hypothetical protein LAY41_17220 [Argonema galeatum A003/A1]|nr:hypothetical protein [Argonema galeatum A003/A1]
MAVFPSYNAIALSNPTSTIAYGTLRDRTRIHHQKRYTYGTLCAKAHATRTRSHSPIPPARLPTARTRVRTHIHPQTRTHSPIPKARLPTARIANAPTSIPKHDMPTARYALRRTLRERERTLQFHQHQI